MFGWLHRWLCCCRVLGGTISCSGGTNSPCGKMVTNNLNWVKSKNELKRDISEQGGLFHLFFVNLNH